MMSYVQFAAGRIVAGMAFAAVIAVASADELHGTTMIFFAAAWAGACAIVSAAPASTAAPIPLAIVEDEPM
jgi:hypothetical protein